MRTLFLLLLFFNLAFFAYATLVRERAAAERPLAALQVAPEKIRLLQPGEAAPPAVSDASRNDAAPVLAAAPPVACVEWSALAGVDVARADAALAKLELPAGRVNRTVSDAGGYWVYLPPAKTKAELDRRLGELSALGIGEFFVIQDATPWRNAVSLGIFKTEAAAQAFLDGLHAKGLKSAIAARREKFLKQIAYFVREPDEATVARLAELQRGFPGTRMRAVPCPAPDG